MKNISVQRLKDSALRSTMKTMSIEGRLPRDAPRLIDGDSRDRSAVDALKPTVWRTANAGISSSDGETMNDRMPGEVQDAIAAELEADSSRYRDSPPEGDWEKPNAHD